VNQLFFRIKVGKAVFSHYMTFWMLADKQTVVSIDFSTIADVQVFGYLLLYLLGFKLDLDYSEYLFITFRSSADSVDSAPCFVF